MTDLDPAVTNTIQVVVTFLAPLVGAIPGQMSGKVRGYISAGVAVAIIAIIDFQQGNFDVATFGGKAVAAFMFAHAAYTSFWANRDINTSTGRTPATELSGADFNEFVSGDDDDTPVDEDDEINSLVGHRPGSKAACLAWMAAEVGYNEAPGNKTKYAKVAGHPNGYAWCATFVSANLITNGVLQKGHKVLVGSSRTMFDQAVKLGWQVRLQDVQPGDVAHTKRPGGWLGHVAFVSKVVRDSKGKVIAVHTIEGNTNGAGSATGGAVLRKNRPILFWKLGFWRPPYKG
jgi:hypothetical protein